MMKNIMKNFTENNINSMNLPTPSNISFNWNFGSMLSIMMFMQILTGLMLTMNYSPISDIAFLSISDIMTNLNMGWMVRFFHSNGASIFMLLLYIHIGRNIYFNNLKNKMTSMSGMMIFLFSMMTAFLGYVLPWGQMSFWGATVITSLISAIPFIGKILVVWIWGNYSISSITLTRFFTLHYLVPFLMLMMIIFHFIFLHKKGSMNMLSFNNNIEKIQFYPYFLFKDFLTFILLFFIILFLTLTLPFMLMDPENFINANPMLTPIHIQPEWYFLYSYAILRCIPNKLGGVIALLLSIMILIIPIFKKSKKFNKKFFFLSKFIFWFLIMIFMILLWIGANPISEPMIFTAQMFSFFYFFMFILN